MSFFKKLMGNNTKHTPPNTNDILDRVSIELKVKLGKECIDNERYDDAIKYLHEYFKLMEENNFSDLRHLDKPCNYNIAIAYYQTKQYQEAIKHLTKAIELDSKYFEAYYLRIQCYLPLNELKKAILDVDSAVALKPERHDLYMNKGIALLRLGDKNSAKSVFMLAKMVGNTDADNYIKKYCQ